MKTELRQGEQVLREGAANLQKNVEVAGGKLCLTKQRLVIDVHKFTVQGGRTELELASSQSSVPFWTRFLGFTPLFPNS